METFLTAEEVAQKLKLCPRVVRALLKRGELPGRKIGAQWRVPEHDLSVYTRGNQSSKQDAPQGME